MRWRRRSLTLLGLVLVGSTLAACSSRAGDASEANCPVEDGELFVLMAQSVPSATLLPCIEALPAGWTYGGSDVGSGTSTFWHEDVSETSTAWMPPRSESSQKVAVPLPTSDPP